MVLRVLQPLQRLMPERIRTAYGSIRPVSAMLGMATAILLGFGYVWVAPGSRTTAASETLSTVERQTLISSVKAVGKVTFSSEQKMRFNQKGTVAKVHFAVGDRVQKGQVIAELDKTTVLADVRSQQLSIAGTQLQLAQQRNDQLKTVQDAENALKVAQTKFPSDLAGAKRAVEERQKALEQAKLDLAKQQTTEIQSLALTAQTILTGSEKLLDSYYTLLTRGSAARPNQGNYDLTIDHHLYRDSVLKDAVVTAYLTSTNIAARMHEQFGSSLTSENDAEIILQALSSAQTLAQAANELGEATYAMLQGATTDVTGSPSSGNPFTPDSLSTTRATVIGNRGSSATLVNQAQTAQANLRAASSQEGIPSVTLQQKRDAVTTAENSFAAARENLAVVETQTPGDLKSKEQAYDAAKNTTAINIQLKQNTIGQQAASLQKLLKTLDDYKLAAPFDGIITHIDYKAGDNLLDTGDTEYLVIQNPDFIIVTIPLDQTDVVRVKKEMPATIAFDAVQDRTFDGVIDEIDPTPIETSGVVSYNVQIRLPTPKDLTVLSGMTATVQIETARKENVLVVPNLALRQGVLGPTVQRADGTSVQVKTGMTNGRYTEILTGSGAAGLNVGDSIVSLNITKQTTNSTTQSTNIMRFGGGGGGAPPGGGRGG